MAQKVIPVGKKLLLKPKKQEEVSKGGIFIPEIARKVEYKGTVIGKGKDVSEMEIGDMVQYTDHCLPTPMMHDGIEHLLIQEGDVYAILVNE